MKNLFAIVVLLFMVQMVVGASPPEIKKEKEKTFTQELDISASETVLVVEANVLIGTDLEDVNAFKEKEVWGYDLSKLNKTSLKTSLHKFTYKESLKTHSENIQKPCIVFLC